MKEAQKAISILKNRNSTVEQLAMQIYGSEGSYAIQSIHAMIYRLRKKGFKIVSEKDEVDLRIVVYTLY